MKSQECGGAKRCFPWESDFGNNMVWFESTQWTETVYTLVVLSSLHRVVSFTEQQILIAVPSDVLW